ncbi:MAG: protein kinase [Clostridiales bacterium]|nr:protein kinase [Clostridiales bacterium]
MVNKLISGRYSIISTIGTGGMSVVYKAKDEKTGRIVALKILKDEYRKDADFIKRFRHEATAAQSLNHPNIVKLYTVGSDQDTQYITMEYINGRTLSDIIHKDGPLSESRCVRYAVKILDALSHAHKKGIVHRDIKPDNILIDENDNVKVADFGIARMAGSKEGTVTTNSNIVVGSVHYVSPEQAQFNEADARSDIYSMGIVLYEMLTGTVPFDGDTPVAIALQHIKTLPSSMRLINKNISKGLDEVVLKALQKKPEMRYQTAANLSKDLKRSLRYPKGGFVNHSAIGAFLFRNGLNSLLIGLSVITIVSLIIYGFVNVSDILYGVDVPEVIGLEESEAVERIRDAQLSPVTEYQYSYSIDEGHVISQSPASGRTRQNRSVSLIVSLGAQPVALPDTVGMDNDEALRLLSEHGFPKVLAKYTYDAEMKNGTVLEQTPNEGLAKPGETITLTINAQLEQVPPLTGRSKSAAIEILESRALGYEIIYAYSTDGYPDTVLLQSPSAGALISKGSTVRLYVSLQNPVTYSAVYSIKIPLNLDVRLVLKTPSGSEKEVFSRACEMDEAIYLELESSEEGVHIMDIYFDGVLRFSEEIDFK